MSNPDNRDAVAELADRILAKQRRGEEWEFEFEIEFASLTYEERDDFVALMNERAAHKKENLEAIGEDNRVLLALRDLVESSGAPPGTTLWEAGEAGYVGVMEVVESIRAVPDPLGQQKPD
jgi:hypothetical protein